MGHKSILLGNGEKMARNTPKSRPDIDEEVLQDKPAKTLLNSWSKRLTSGSAVGIPVFIGGTWSLQVPRGNKRVLQLSVNKANKS
jgi:hypothetical protein